MQERTRGGASISIRIYVYYVTRRQSDVHLPLSHQDNVSTQFLVKSQILSWGEAGKTTIRFTLLCTLERSAARSIGLPEIACGQAIPILNRGRKVRLVH
jgi:hypothetical protein